MKKNFKVLMYGLLLVCMFFIASCQRKIYTLTFEENGGTEVSDLQVPVNEIPKAPSNPTKEGHTFSGWYLDENLKFKYNFGKMEGNITVYAKWDVNSYSISYVTNCPTQLSSTRVAYGSEIELSDAPARPGYDFVGWYTDAALTQEFALNTMPANNITLYAAWDAHDFIVKFISQDEEITDLRQSVEYGNTITKPEDLVREGYSFKGWYIEEETYDFAQKVTDHITLTAKWEINSYTITYDTNGGSKISSETYTYRSNLVEPDRPTKVGYVFTGWKLEEETFDFSGAKMPASDITLVAQWLPGEYGIYFNKNNAQATGTVATIATDYEKEELIPANDYELVGYTFVEWNTRSDGLGTSYAPGAKVKQLTTTNSFTLFAIWSANSYTVKFNANGGEGNMTKQELVYDKTALNSNTFTKAGYSFVEWNTKADKTGTSYSANSTNITSKDGEEVELFAIWSANSYTLTYLANGGEGANVEQTVVYDTTKIATNTFTRTGYTFAGWNTKADGTGKNIEEGSVFGMQETTLYAQWTENEYKVVFNANNGTTDKVEQEFAYTDEKALTANTFTKEGYTFAGWSTTASGRVAYEDGKLVKELSSENGAVIELYAVWTANTYTIKFDSNTGTETMEDLAMTYDVAKNLPNNSFVKVGYTFAGWNTQADGTGTPYANNANVKNLLTSGSLTLYAQWTENEYKVVFNANNGTIDKVEQEFAYTDEKALTANTFTKEGYTFAGWSTTASGRVVYEDGKLVKELSSENGAVIELYAVWTANTYTIKFDSNTGTETMEDLAMTYDVAKNLPNNSFVKVGYTFAEWNTQADGTGTPYANNANVKNLLTSGSLTLYAQWTINSYTFTIYYNGETDKEEITLTYNALISATTKTQEVEARVDFDKWLTTPGDVEFEFDSINMPAYNFAVYAKYKNQVTITFDTNGGSSIAPIQGYVGDNYQAPATNPTKKGYTFTGWYTTKECNVLFDFNGKTMEDGGLTIYAGWQEHTYEIKFDGNGATGVAMSNQEFTYTEEKALSENTFVRTGYTFEGWATSANSDVVAYNDQATVKELTENNNATITLYAVWSENSYELVLHSNYGTDSTSVKKLTYTETVKLENPFARTGYTFVGWNTKANETGISYENNKEVSGLSSVNESDFDLYAIWQEHTYEIKFDGNGATGVAMSNQEFTYTEEKALSENTFVRTGYTFEGWATSANSDVVVYNNQVTVKELTVENNVTITLYAVWSENSYELVLHSNYGTDSTSVKKLTYTETVKLENPFARTGYTFVGWNTKANETGISYENNKEVSGLSAVNGSEFDLYAVWTAHKYTVVFNGNSGLGSMTNQEMTYDISVLKSNEFTKYGYSFTGWNTKADGTGVSYSNNSSENLTSENDATITLYAQWTANVYNLTYKANGGIGNDVKQVGAIFDSTTLLNNSFTRTGYEFAGWNTKADGSGNNYLAGSVLATTETILYAKWNELSYVVTLQHGKNDISVNLDPVLYSGQITLSAPSTFTYEGYTLIGWAFDENEAVKFTVGQQINLNELILNHASKTANLVGVWEANALSVTFIDSSNSSEIRVLNPKYDDKYSSLDITTVKTYISTKYGYRFGGYYTDSSLSEESKIVFDNNTTSIFTENMNVYVKFEQISYTVKFMLDGETIYSVSGKHYGDSVSFHDYVVKLNNDLPIIKKFEGLLLSVIGGANPSELPAILSGNAGTVGAVSYAAGEIAQVYAVDQRIASANLSDIPGLYSIVNTIKNDIELRVASYRLNFEGKYVPVKDNLIFGDWVLGDGMYYSEDAGEGSVYNGTVPASNDSDEDGTEIRIIGKWKGVPAITGTLYDPNTKVLSWDAVNLDPSITNPSITYEIYHEFEVEGSTVKVKMDSYVNPTVTNGKVSYQVDTENPSADKYYAPGSYLITIKAIINYEDANGNIVTLESENSKAKAKMDISALTISGVTVNEGDYYLQKEEESGELVFYFFTNMEYTFSGSTFEFVNYDNSQVVDGEEYKLFAEIDGSVIKTKATGSFYFRTKEKPEVYYLGRVLPFVSQYDLGESLQQFNSYKDGSVNSLYLEDLSSKVYKIGVNTNSNGNIKLTKTINATTYDNGFIFDLSIKTTGGKNIDYSQYGNYLVYEFKDITNNVVIPNEIMGYYDEASKAWYFNEKLLTHRYDAQTQSLVADENAANNMYQVSIEINKEYAPLILTDKEYGSANNRKVGKGLIKAKVINFQLNDCINVFNHEELKAVYEDIKIKSGINIHADIKTVLAENQYYTGEYGSSKFDSKCYAWNMNDTTSGLDAYTKALGSVINPELYDYMTLLKSYESQGKSCKDLPTGHPYLRASATDLEENFVINGNLFNIDASEIGFASIYSISNLSTISGYKIANTKTSIFTYLVTNYTGNSTTQQYTMTSNSSITFNDLSIKGNTVNSSLSSDGIELMNRNSGGHCGIQSWYGATMNINNTVITNATIAVYVAQNSSANVNYLYSGSNWANTIYAYGAQSLSLTNSHIKDSGGAAIHFEDLKSTTTNPTTATIYIDNSTKFENYISGEEGYFKANSMELVVLQLKSGFENISKGMSGNQYTLIERVTNPVTGNPSEKLNLILLCPPAGNNKNLAGQASADFGGNWAGQSMVNVTIGNTTNAETMQISPQLPPVLGAMPSMNTAQIDATLDATQIDALKSQVSEPGFGIFFVANGNEKASSGLYKNSFYVTSYATGPSVMGTALIILGAKTE